MRRVIVAPFASVLYTRAADPFENYFQAVLWLVFVLLGRYVHTEIHQVARCVDCVVEVRVPMHVMEIKRDGTAAEALAQIDEHGYATPCEADSRELHLIGCAFNSNTRLFSD